MPKRIPVTVSGDTRWGNRRKIKKFGVRKRRGDAVCGYVRESDFAVLDELCRKNGMYLATDNAYGKRSKSYRRVFFNANPPVLGRFYFCAYCGRLLTRRTVTIDHLYPVGVVRKSPKLQKKLKRKHIGLNDAGNLVAACSACNKKKGTKMGYWIRIGQIGSHPLYWELRWLLRLSIMSFFTAMLALYIYA